MLSYLSGTIFRKKESSLTVLVNGVGYLVRVPSCLTQATATEQPIELFIHTHIREDAFELFGFESEADLEFFTQLISVSGIGPKIALEILNQPLDAVKSAILTGDEAVLINLPGIGKKTAGRLILELKNKVSPAEISSATTKKLNANTDALEALASLGYDRHQVLRTLNDLPPKVTSTEEIVKWFLREA